MQQAAAVGTVRQNPRTVLPSARVRTDQQERAPPPGLRSAPQRGRTAPGSAPRDHPQSDPRTDPRRPPAAPDSVTPPEAVKKSGSKNPRHVTIVSMACHYCSACHYCHGMRHMWHAAIAPPSRDEPCISLFLARMWSLRGAAPTQKQATCRASYKRSIQCSVIALLSTCKACCLLWRYDSP